MELKFAISLLREGVCQNIIVSRVALSLLVRETKHLRQDVRRTECGVHLPLAQIASFVSSFKLLPIKMRPESVRNIKLTSLHSVSPLSKSMLFSLI